MNMEEQLRAVVNQATTNAGLWHNIVHGDDTQTVETENGTVPSVAKQLKDIRNAIMGGVVDIISVAESARDGAIVAKEQAETIKSDTQAICDEVAELRDETESFKDLSQTTFNNIATATATSLTSIQNETATQISNVETSAEEQIVLAKAEADRSLYYAQSAAPTPLGSKLTVPACVKVPDGYEPTWHKNTITRARYPDFFEKLVDTDALFCLDEATYDAQVTEFGMCNSYVKVDDNTLILPLLLNYSRSGSLNQVGQVQDDQFQGHHHSNQIRQDVYGSGDGAAITTSTGTDEGLRFDGPDMFVLNPKTGEHGNARFGDETRPKSYFELTYIKCADVVRPLAVEETSEIRNLLFNKVNLDLGNLLADVINDKLFETIVDGTNWYIRNKVTGWTEQGGLTPTIQTGTITFIKPFVNPALNIQLTQHYNAASRADKYTPQVVGVPTNTAFNYGWGSGYVAGSYLYWRACGY